MRKSVVILLLVMIALTIFGIFIQLKGIREANLNNQIVGLIVGEENFEAGYNISDVVDEGITEINSDQKYVNFINQSAYHSVELKIAGENYFIEYDSKLNLVARRFELESPDFKVKINQRELNKMIKLYEDGNYRAFAMRIVNKVPWRVKMSLFKQCKATDWCSAEFFGGQKNSS